MSIFSAACACSLVMPALGANLGGNAAAWDLAQLMLDLQQVKAAKARFVEHKYFGVLDLPLESAGTLIYAAPDKLEKHTQWPKAETLAVEKDKLTITRAEGQQHRTLALQDYPEIWAFVESIRATLAGDLPTLRRIYDVDLEGNAGDWQLLLQPKDKKMRDIVQSIRISGNRVSLRSIEVVEADGDHSVMTILPDAS